MNTSFLAGAVAAVSIAKASAQVYDWTMIAGLTGGSADGTNSGALFYHPQGVTADTNGNLYVADSGNYTIRKIAPSGTNWVVTTIAGQAGSPASTDGTNNAARFNYPYGIAVDSGGNLFVTDTYTVRKITQSGADWVVTTVAGQAGTYGSADGTNSEATFAKPRGVAVDVGGNLYVADTYNHTIRKVSPVGTNWVVTTIAGLAASSGTADGTNTTARFKDPSGIAVDGFGILFVADTFNDTIREITPVGTNWAVTTLAGQAGTAGSSDGTNSVAQFSMPQGIAVDNSGSLYAADTDNHAIRKVTPTGTNWVVTTVAGSAASPGAADGTNSSASFLFPSGVAADTAGNVYIADTSNNMVRKATSAGTNRVVSTLAGVSSYGNSDGTNSAARFNEPWSVAVDSSKNVYVADYGNSAVRKVIALGTNWVVSTLAAGVGVQGIAVGSNSNLFLGNSSVVQMLTATGTNWLLTTIAGKRNYSGYTDGTNGTARFVSARGLGVDSSGNVYVADQWANTIRKLTPLGTNWVVTTIAGYPGVSGTNDGVGTNALFRGVSGVVADPGGNLYVADQFNYTVRKVTPVGTNWVVTTIAGLPGKSGGADGTNSDARFDSPGGLSVDTGGNIYVADIGGKIRKVTPMGTNWVVSTIGGGAGGGYTDGTNSAARFSVPNGVAVDTQGNLYIADIGNNNIREGIPLSPDLLGSFGIQNGQFGFTISGPSNIPIVVQARTDLASGTWTNIQSCNITNGSIYFTDPTWTNFPSRFYRISAQYP